MYQSLLTEQKNINRSKQIQTKLTDKQKILLYLKFYSKSKVINFIEFSKVFHVKYRSFQSNIDLLNKKEKIIKPYRNKKPRSYKLIVKPKEIKIFNNATNEEEYLVYQYLRTNNKELENTVNIIINPQALKLFHELQHSQETRFNFNRKTKTLNNLIKFNAVKELDTKLYTLTAYHNREKYKLEQLKLLKQNRPKIISQNFNLNDIIQYTNWSEINNVHNLMLTVNIPFSYTDISLNPLYKPFQVNNSFLLILENVEFEPNTFVTAKLFNSNTLLIYLSCSKNPILVNNTIRLNFILLDIFTKLNEVNPLTKYEYKPVYQWYDYNYIIHRHDFGLDGYLPFKLPRDYNKEYINQNNEIIFSYVKESYKDSCKVRFEQRAITEKYSLANNKENSLPDFRTMIQERKLNIFPRHE
jgi:hypothetical protein